MTGSGDTLGGLAGSALTRPEPDEPVSTVERAAAAARLHGATGARATLDGPVGTFALAVAIRALLVRDE